MWFVISAQSYNSITLGSSLIARDISLPWVSPSKDFAFGFQKIESGSFLLAIWFNKIPESTITCSANRDIPVPRGSKVELTTRSLILTDPSGREVWRARLLAGSSSRSDTCLYNYTRHWKLRADGSSVCCTLAKL
uniref:Uncharacterized protein n=1 Tax=Chenopodium quinoa TaxID=63459 RepID=A0A803MQZ8_CHEQI